MTAKVPMETLEGLVDGYLAESRGGAQAGSFLRHMSLTREGLLDLAQARFNGSPELRAKLALIGFGSSRDLMRDDAARAQASGQRLADLPADLRMTFLLLSDGQDRDEVASAGAFHPPALARIEPDDLHPDDEPPEIDAEPDDLPSFTF